MSDGALRIKICCIQNLAEAELARRHGADAIGLVSAMPSGPGPIPEPLIQGIARAQPRELATFLLTSQPDAGTIVHQVRRAGVTTVQLCDRMPVGSHEELRAALPGVSIVQVVHVEDVNSVAEAVLVSPGVDGILLDSGRPDAAVKQLGGTGRVHDWGLSRRIVESVPVPVWLAGGLTPLNVARAVREVRPHGVDVCSGVRTDGQLDEGKLAAFVAAARDGEPPRRP